VREMVEIPAIDLRLAGGGGGAEETARLRDACARLGCRVSPTSKSSIPPSSSSFLLLLRRNPTQPNQKTKGNQSKASSELSTHERVRNL
jgi:hypothetical protein